MPQASPANSAFAGLSEDELVAMIAVEAGFAGLLDVRRCQSILEQDFRGEPEAGSLAQILEEQGHLSTGLRESLVSRVKKLTDVAPTEATPAQTKSEEKPRRISRRFESIQDHVQPSAKIPGPPAKKAPAEPAASQPAPPKPPAGPKAAGRGPKRYVPSYKKSTEELSPMVSGIHAAQANDLRQELGIRKGTSQPRRGARGKDGPDPTADLKKIVETIVTGRAHQQVLELLVDHSVGIIEPHLIAKRTGLKEKQIRAVLDRWKTLGIVKAVGTHPYSFGPGKGTLRQINFFLEHWKQSAWRTKIMAMLIAKES